MTYKLRHLAMVVVLMGVLVAVQSIFGHHNAASTIPAQTSSAFTHTGSCRSAHDLPDGACTPGAVDPRVTQANIQTTICQAGYAATVRPSTSVTNPIKTARMAAYGASGTKADYELDHLISLELGGAPADPKNLWPEPYAGSAGAREKDKIENRLHTLVCNGAVTLSEAQTAIATDWKQAAATYDTK